MTEPSYEPLSWLMLERYALGELPPLERRRVAEQLAQSPADRAILAQIEGDESVLAPLPVVAIGPTQTRKRAAWPVLSGVAALAAAVMLALLRGPISDLPSRRDVTSGVKGGEVALALYSDQVGEAPVSFAPGERFKLLVTCPPWFHESLAVVVFQGGERSSPLEPTRLPCGNHVPWPGAFTLDGPQDVQVCLTWSASAQRATSPEQLAPRVVCTKLKARDAGR